MGVHWGGGARALAFPGQKVLKTCSSINITIPNIIIFISYYLAFENFFILTP